LKNLLLFLLVFTSIHAFGQDNKATDNETPPSFDFDMGEFLSKNLHMPVEAAESCIVGKVLVRFAIDSAGNIGDVQVRHGIHPLLDNEAMRVIKLIKHAKPGMKNGRPVTVYMTQRFNFYVAGERNCPDADAHFNAAVELYGKGKIDDALKNFKKAAKLNYADVQALFSVASIYISKNSSAEACPYLKQILDVSGGKNLDYDINALIAKHCTQ
jgi:TonB family protein